MRSEGSANTLPISNHTSVHPRFRKAFKRRTSQASKRPLTTPMNTENCMPATRCLAPASAARSWCTLICSFPRLSGLGSHTISLSSTLQALQMASHGVRRGGFQDACRSCGRPETPEIVWSCRGCRRDLRQTMERDWQMSRFPPAPFQERK